MLLTGFDAPRLKKIYFTRVIKAHNLLQALTRVNRPYNKFKFGYVVDFADIHEEFKKTKGLGLVKGNVVSLDKNKMIVPHVGWNQVETTNQNNSIPKNMNSFYFVHSFYAQPKNLADIFYSTRAKTQYRTKDKVKLYKESLDFIEEVSRKEREVTGMKLARKEYEGEGRWSLI